MAEQFNLRLRHVVLMLRQAGVDQLITSQQMSVLGSLEHGPRRMTELAIEQRVVHEP